jgi:hypothetical protein
MATKGESFIAPHVLVLHIYVSSLKPNEPPPEAGAPAPPQDDAAGPARPAWRTVHKRAERKERALAKMAPPSPAPAPPPEPAMPNMPAWAQWRREWGL